jgi:hypothetical protein
MKELKCNSQAFRAVRNSYMSYGGDLFIVFHVKNMHIV